MTAGSAEFAIIVIVVSVPSVGTAAMASASEVYFVDPICATGSLRVVITVVIVGSTLLV